MSSAILSPAGTEELADVLKQNAEGEKRPVLAVGGGTWLDFGRPVSPGIELHTKNLSRIVDYPARDMTITVEAGLTVGKLADILREERQQIPVDFPQADEATVGGVIAANISGPRRFGLGTLRDYVIGLTAVDAGGRVFHSGGRVVKNVAGYDLCKLMVGSWGTLAVLSEVTWKVLPLPETKTWIWTAWDSAEKLETALGALLTSETRPLAVEVLNAPAAGEVAQRLSRDLPCTSFVLAVLVAGSTADADWQAQKLTEKLSRSGPSAAEVLADAGEELQQTLTDYAIAPSPLTFRANLPPSKTVEFIDRATEAGFRVQSHAANGIVIGHAPKDLQTIEAAEKRTIPLRQLAELHQGSLILLRCSADWKTQLDVFGTRSSSWGLMQNLKQSLDPDDLLSRGRLFEPRG